MSAGCTNQEVMRRLCLPASLRTSSREFWVQVRCAYLASERTYLDTRLKIDPNFVAVAGGLKERYLLAMLSNDVTERSAYLRRRFALDRLFTSVVISGDHGFRQPDRRLYDALLQSLNVAPHRCVFVEASRKIWRRRRNWGCAHYAESETIAIRPRTSSP